MFKTSHRITALITAILLLVASFGFTLDVHYCGNEAKSFSLIGKAKSCSKAKHQLTKRNKKHHCCKGKEADFKRCKKGLRNVLAEKCCHNETYRTVISADHKVESLTVPTTVDFLNCSSAIEVLKSFQFEKSSIRIQSHPPPDIPQVSFNILYQVFRV